MLDLDSLSALRDIVPENLRNDERVSDAISALERELQAVSVDTQKPVIFGRIDELQSGVLDHLAWQLNSNTWNDAWPIKLKRSVIRSLILGQSKKGTRFAIEDAVRSMGSAITIKEWWEDGADGQPHTFQISLSVNDLQGDLAGLDTQSDLLRRVNDAKPVRSQYTWSLSTDFRGGVGTKAALRPATYSRINCRAE